MYGIEECRLTSITSQLGVQIKLGKLSPTADWTDARKKAYEARLPTNYARKLQRRFNECTMKTSDKTPAPSLDELKTDHAEASEEVVFEIIMQCARWICFGVRLSSGRGQGTDGTVASENKWTAMDRTPWTEQQMSIIESISTEELRSMLADAFEDIETRVGGLTGEGETGYPIVKQGASVPNPAKEWYWVFLPREGGANYMFNWMIRSRDG